MLHNLHNLTSCFSKDVFLLYQETEKIFYVMVAAIHCCTNATSESFISMVFISTAHMNLIIKCDNLPKYFKCTYFLYCHVVSLINTRTDCSALSYIMLVMRVAELLLITVITVLLFRARGEKIQTNIC